MQTAQKSGSLQHSSMSLLANFRHIVNHTPCFCDKARSWYGQGFFDIVIKKLFNSTEDKMTNYTELLKKRRSIRDYEDKEVSIETIKEIIRESCLAPSSGNGQPWQFIIITDKAMIKTLSDESKRSLLVDTLVLCLP